MEIKAYLWPKTLRARLLLLLAPLLCLTIVISGIFLSEHHRQTLLKEKQAHLFGITRTLFYHLQEKGGYSELEGRAGNPPWRTLSAALSPDAEHVAKAFPGIGVGYYHRRLDVIVTYAPVSEHGSHIGHPIPADHPGHRVMRSGQAEIEQGNFLRGSVMNAMTPIVEKGQVVGYIWANELIDSIERDLDRVRRTILLFGAAALFLSLFLAYVIVTRLTRDVSQITGGLHLIGNDLHQRLPELDGETGDIAAAINQMAASLLAAQEKERLAAENSLRQREETLRATIAAIDEAFVLYDPDDRLLFCNEKYRRLLPQAQDILLTGRTHTEIARDLVAQAQLSSPVSPSPVSSDDLLADLLAYHQRGEGHLELKTREGRWLRMIDRKTATGHTVGLRIDITNLKRAIENSEAANRKLEEIANRDSLTGLYNRRCMDHRTDRLWNEARLLGDSFALLVIDIDNFKHYNDRYGHQAGDQCLRAIATAIANSVDQFIAANSVPQGFAARYGGEEFAVIIAGAHQPACNSLAENIASAVRELNITHNSNEQYGIVTVSIGLACIAHASGSIADLFRCADDRLYRAKSLGRNRVESG